MTMFSIAARATNRNAGLRRVLLRALNTEAKKATPSITKAEVPPELQVMAGYAEYVDSMMEKAEKLEAKMEDLKKTYAKKQDLKPTIKWMDSDEIDRLFIEASEQKDVMAAEIAELKEMLKTARTVFAVDAPDGQTDWQMKQEMEEINHIINAAAENEDKEAVEREHAIAEELRKKVFAVDAPDGETDGHIGEEMLEVAHIIDDAAVLEDKEAVEREHAMVEEMRKKIYAVDAPDGEADGHIGEEMMEVNHIIDDAAVLEDKEAVERKHNIEFAVKKDRAKDPEHDW